MSVEVSDLLVGGPKVVAGTMTAVSGETSKGIDITSLADIENIEALVNVIAFKAASAHAIATVDYTTTAGTLTVTFADPLANITIYFTVLAR